MKYILMMHGQKGAWDEYARWSEEVLQRNIEFMGRFNPELKEFLAGYWVIDVDSPEQAYKIASRASAASGPGGQPTNIPIEVRQVLGRHHDLGF